MSRAQITLSSRSDRERAIHWIGRAPAGTRVVFRESKRTTEQNDRMWAMLTDVASQLDWHGKKLPPDDWKLLFLDALSREERLVPSLDGEGFVDLGRSSSNLGKRDFSNLLELIGMFGANHGVIFHDSDSFQSAPLAGTDKPATGIIPTPSSVAGNHSNPSDVAPSDGRGEGSSGSASLPSPISEIA